ncbi:MAG: MFS transporter [[Clostridium] scindens]
MGNFIAAGILKKGWNAAIVGLAYSMRLIPSAISPLVGIILARFGPRRTIFWTTLLTSIIVIICGYFDSAWGFVFGFGLAVGVSMYFNDNLACTTVINNWWENRRGQMSSMLMTFSYAGGVIFPLIIAWMLRTFEWKTTMWLCGLLLFCITALPQFFWMKDRPAEMGLKIEEGLKPKQLKKKKRITNEPADEPEDWDVKSALKTPQIWILGILYGFICTPFIVVMNYSITHLEMNGMGGMQATYFISGLSVTTFIFTLFIGTIVDYLGVKKSFILAFLMGAVGIISIVFVNCSYLTWIIPLICCPFPMSMGLPIVTTAVGDYYGKKNFSIIWGFALPLTTLATIGISPLVGIMLAHLIR